MCSCADRSSDLFVDDCVLMTIIVMTVEVLRVVCVQDVFCVGVLWCVSMRLVCQFMC